MTQMRTRVWTLQGLLVLAANGCHANEVAKVEPSPAPEVEPRDVPKPTPVEAPEPAPKAEPAPQPEPAPIASWEPNAEPNFLEDELVDSTANTVRYSLEKDQLHYRLELRVRDDITQVTLTERDTSHALVHEWPTNLCGDDLEYGVSVSLAELAHDQRGRKLFNLWVSCRLGEDIVFTDSLELIVLADADRLTTLWSGRTSRHASHVCGEWQDIELEFEKQELLITEYDRAKIFLPNEIPGYDCDENSREYDTVRARHRIALP
jgi:hypothetical protein